MTYLRFWIPISLKPVLPGLRSKKEFEKMTSQKLWQNRIHVPCELVYASRRSVPYKINGILAPPYDYISNIIYISELKQNFKSTWLNIMFKLRKVVWMFQSQKWQKQKIINAAWLLQKHFKSINWHFTVWDHQESFLKNDPFFNLFCVNKIINRMHF